MKRIAAFILAVTVILVFSSCGFLKELLIRNAGDTDNSTETQETEETEIASVKSEIDTETENEPETAQQISYPRISAAIERYYDEKTADDGNILLTCDISVPKVYIKGNAYSQQAINSVFGEIMSASKISETEYYNWAKTEYTALEETEKESWYGYALYREYEVIRADEAIISVRMRESSYTGGAHPNGGDFGYTFDTKTGELITLGDIVIDKEAFIDFAKNYIISSIEAEGSEAMYYEDYQGNIGNLFDDQCWYMTDTGISFVANPYLLAPYAAGVLTFNIPYSQLEGKLKAGYLPVAADIVSTNIPDPLSISYTEDFQSQNYYTDNLFTDDPGRNFVISSSEPVKNVIIESINYENEPDIQTRQIYCSTVIGYNDAVICRIYLAEIMPNIKITYTLANGQTESRYISESGKDGSIFLAPIS